ncbi:MAG: hypothetical protein ACPLZF_03465 [Nitrososphaeria archaeon]
MSQQPKRISQKISYILIILSFALIIFFTSTTLYHNPVETGAQNTGGPRLVWKGNGTSDYVDISALYYNASVLEYDVLRSALKDRFGEAFKEVGFSYEGYHERRLWTEWRIVFKEISLTEEDIMYIRSYFPRTYTVEVWTGVETCTIMIMKPPIIQIETKTNSTITR